MTIFDYLAYPPIAKGMAALLISGATFPLIGLFILRLHLVPLRYTLMHGAILGGAVGIFLGISPLVASLLINLAFSFFLGSAAEKSGGKVEEMTAFFMVLSLGISSLLISLGEVPFQTSLQIFWGSIYTISDWEFWLATGISLTIIIGTIVRQRQMRALLFNKEIAFATGINIRVLTIYLLVIIAFVISMAMRLIGALLLDALLILPALCALKIARSARGLFILAPLFGVAVSTVGGLLSLLLDISAGASITIVSALLFGSLFLVNRIRDSRS